MFLKVLIKDIEDEKSVTISKEIRMDAHVPKVGDEIKFPYQVIGDQKFFIGEVSEATFTTYGYEVTVPITLDVNSPLIDDIITRFLRDGFR